MTTNGYVPSALKVSPRNLPEIAPSDHEVAKGWLRPALKRWCERTCEGVEHGERTAMNNYARAMGMIGGDVIINLNLQAMKELGCTMDEARRLIGMAKSVEGIDHDGAVSIMEGHVRKWYADRGQRLLVVKDSEAVGP